MSTALKRKLARAAALLMPLMIILPGPYAARAGDGLRNSRPVISVNKGLTVDEDSPEIAIRSSELKSVDEDSDRLIYTLTSAPAKGVLYRSRKVMNAVTNSRFTQEDIDAGLLTYMPLEGAEGQDSFAFTVSDSAETVAGVFKIYITPKNHPPVLAANKGAAVDEGGGVTLSKALLEAADKDQSPSQLIFTLTAAPSHGKLYANKAELDVKNNSSFTQEDINGGALSYVNDGSDNTEDSFAFTVSDRAGGAIGETVFSIRVRIINDAPVIGACGPLTVTENSAAVPIKISSSDDEKETLSYTLAEAPAKGSLKNKKTGAELSKGKSFTQAELDQGYIVYTPARGFIGSDKFSFEVSDGHNRTSGSFAITITPLNRAPEITSAKNVFCLSGAGGTAYAAKASDINGDKITWSISGKDSGLLDIDSVTGEVSFLEPPLYFRPLDSDKNNVYEVTITASDGKLKSEQAVKITVEQYLPASQGTTNGVSGSGGEACVIVNGSPLFAGVLDYKTGGEGGGAAAVSLDSETLLKALAAQPAGAELVVPISGEPEAASVVIAGDAVKGMAARETVLVVDAGIAVYTVPAAKIDIGAAAARLGAEPEDISVTVGISRAGGDTEALIESAAKEGGFKIAAPAVEFSIECAGGGHKYEVESFGGFVERLIAVPDGVDPRNITAGITIKTDGASCPVPAQLVSIGGRDYVKLSSFTNSAYALVSRKAEFKDMGGHWAKDAVNDLGSRMVVGGGEDGRFRPDEHMTRAELAAVLVRAMGLAPKPGKSSFTDVSAGDWYCGYLETAADCGLIYGYGDGSIGAGEAVTREQAMTMMARAMKLAGLYVKLDGNGISQLMTLYKDGFSTSRYAGESAALCLYFGVVTGDDGGMLRPKALITRAEAAVMIRRLLLKADLI